MHVRKPSTYVTRGTTYTRSRIEERERERADTTSISQSEMNIWWRELWARSNSIPTSSGSLSLSNPCTLCCLRIFYALDVQLALFAYILLLCVYTTLARDPKRARSRIRVSREEYPGCAGFTLRRTLRYIGSEKYAARLETEIFRFDTREYMLTYWIFGSAYIVGDLSGDFACLYLLKNCVGELNDLWANEK